MTAFTKFAGLYPQNLKWMIRHESFAAIRDKMAEALRFVQA